MLGDLGRVYDDAVALIESLARDLQRDPAQVERFRNVLSRSLLVSGLTTPSLESLINAREPLRSDEIIGIKQDIQALSSSLRALIVSRAPAKVTFGRDPSTS